MYIYMYVHMLREKAILTTSKRWFGDVTIFPSFFAVESVSRTLTAFWCGNAVFRWSCIQLRHRNDTSTRNPAPRSGSKHARDRRERTKCGVRSANESTSRWERSSEKIRRESESRGKKPFPSWEPHRRRQQREGEMEKKEATSRDMVRRQLLPLEPDFFHTYHHVTRPCI